MIENVNSGWISTMCVGVTLISPVSSDIFGFLNTDTVCETNKSRGFPFNSKNTFNTYPHDETADTQYITMKRQLTYVCPSTVNKCIEVTGRKVGAF